MAASFYLDVSANLKMKRERGCSSELAFSSPSHDGPEKATTRDQLSSIDGKGQIRAQRLLLLDIRNK